MIKVAIVLALLCGSKANVLFQPVKNADDFGSAIQYNNQDENGNYNFGYNEGHLSGGSFRRESGDIYGNKMGSYGLKDADGRLRIVNYIADANGFRAEIQTNEPGVEAQDPASTRINKQPTVIAEPIIQAPAPPVALPVREFIQRPVSTPVEFIRRPVPLPVGFPTYANLVPYPAATYLPYKGLPPPIPAAYYANSYFPKTIAAQPLIREIAPAYTTLQYGFYNGKSLPMYQPLGYS